MCSSGGPMADIDLKKLKTKKYRCLDCGNEFIFTLSKKKFEIFPIFLNIFLIKITLKKNT